MTFWIFAILLTIAAILAVCTPLIARPEAAPDAIEFDKELYKARLEEIRRDVALGRLTEEEAAAGEAEEGRKLLALANKSEGRKGFSATGSLARLALISCLVVIPVGGAGIYALLGNPQTPDQPLAARMQSDPSGQSIGELVSRAEAHLADNPDDARGWEVLAPVYTRLGRFEDAANAWSNVYRIDPDYPEIRSTLGESLMGVSNGIVTSAARKLFEEELELNPGSTKSRYYLAMALGQEGKNEASATAWQKLIESADPNAPWIPSALQFRDEARLAAGLPAIEKPSSQTASAPGPSAEDVEAASRMSVEERMEMISGMVDGLASKLEEDPSDKEGWLRLVRAYVVLGRQEEAADAVEVALLHHGSDQQFRSALEQLASGAPSGAPASPPGN